MRYILLVLITLFGCTEVHEDGVVRFAHKDKMRGEIIVNQEKNEKTDEPESDVSFKLHWESN